jgi:hypothetical protein
MIESIQQGLKTCSRSSEQHCYEGQVNERQVRVVSQRSCSFISVDFPPVLQDGIRPPSFADCERLLKSA